MAIPDPDIREVTRIEALCTVEGDERQTDRFLERCVPGSKWLVQIRTAEVVATVLSRVPLGTFPENVCTCVKLRLNRAVPVEPGLRFAMLANDTSGVAGTCVVRPWGG